MSVMRLDLDDFWVGLVGDLSVVRCIRDVGKVGCGDTFCTGIVMYDEMVNLVEGDRMEWA